MIQIEEQKDLDLVADEILSKINEMSISQLKKQKLLWEERICNDKVDSPLQKVRLKVLRSLSRELDSRG